MVEDSLKTVFALSKVYVKTHFYFTLYQTPLQKTVFGMFLAVFFILTN